MGPLGPLGYATVPYRRWSICRLPIIIRVSPTCSVFVCFVYVNRS